MNLINKKIIFKIFLLLLVVLLPFSFSNYNDNVKPEKITSDLRFYEINTCSISLNEFLSNNLNVIYQDHYKVKFNNYSSISCFGKITGIDQINHVFYISIGTNVIVNLFLQSLLYLLIISFIKKENNYKIDLKKILAITLTAVFFCFQIYSESRFYEKSLFQFDLTIFPSYARIFVYFFTLSLFIDYFFESRSKQLINYLPFSFLIFGLFGGTNFYFLYFVFTQLGIYCFFRLKSINFIYKLYFLATLLWGVNALGENYFLEPDKIRGSSNTTFNFLSVSLWSVLAFMLITGCYFYIKENKKYLDINLLIKCFYVSSIFILLFGILSSNFPYINFLSYYFFGLNKLPTSNSNIFSRDQWGEIIAWRGILPSAETSGEIFGFLIILILISNLKFEIKKFQLLSALFIPFFGLLASNNKASIVCVFFSIIIIFKDQISKIKYWKIFFPGILILLIFYFIRFENLFYSFEFTSKSLISLLNQYALDFEQSTSHSFFNNPERNLFVSFLIALLSQIAFYVNRSELWAIFFARYNPDFKEFIYGSGPFSLAKLYGEINILPYKIGSGQDYGFLLPHSSLLLLMLFTGIIGVLIFVSIFSFNLVKSFKYDKNLFVLQFFIFVNFFKSDSLLYFPYLMLIIFVYTLIKNEYKN